MIEETVQLVPTHVGCSLQEVFLQRVLEVVDCFGELLKQLVVEDYFVRGSISPSP